MEKLKTVMPLDYAKTFLAASTRDVLKDHAFGDSEVFWLRDGRQIAFGYFGRSKSVSIKETKQFGSTSFEDKEAGELEFLGKNGVYERNDAGDPREW